MRGTRCLALGILMVSICRLAAGGCDLKKSLKSDKLRLTGDQEYAAGQYSLALEKYRESLSTWQSAACLDWTNDDGITWAAHKALVRLGDAYEELGNFSAAVDSFVNAGDFPPQGNGQAVIGFSDGKSSWREKLAAQVLRDDIGPTYWSIPAYIGLAGLERHAGNKAAADALECEVLIHRGAAKINKASAMGEDQGLWFEHTKRLQQIVAYYQQNHREVYAEYAGKLLSSEPVANTQARANEPSGFAAVRAGVAQGQGTAAAPMLAALATEQPVGQPKPVTEVNSSPTGAVSRTGVLPPYSPPSQTKALPADLAALVLRMGYQGSWSAWAQDRQYPGVALRAMRAGDNAFAGGCTWYFEIENNYQGNVAVSWTASGKIPNATQQLGFGGLGWHSTLAVPCNQPLQEQLVDVTPAP